jgi:hypothetical protein
LDICPEKGTTLVNPHFSELAKTAGIHGIRVDLHPLTRLGSKKN